MVSTRVFLVAQLIHKILNFVEPITGDGEYALKRNDVKTSAALKKHVLRYFEDIPNVGCRLFYRING